MMRSREGALLGMVRGLPYMGSTGNVGRLPSLPYPGPACAVASIAALVEFLQASDEGGRPSIPVGVWLTGANWGSFVDTPAGREALAEPAARVRQSLARQVSGEWGLTGATLELLYGLSQALRSPSGELLGMARYVVFCWDIGRGEPDQVLWGSEPVRIDGALAADLSEIKTMANQLPYHGPSGMTLADVTGPVAKTVIQAPPSSLSFHSCPRAGGNSQKSVVAYSCSSYSGSLVSLCLQRTPLVYSISSRVTC